MNVSEVISQVRSSNLQIMDDNTISDRFIYNICKNVASLLVKREVNLRKLLNSDNIFTPIECLCLKLVNLNECGVDSCNRARRSQEPLPDLEEGIYGYTIQGVYNIDNSEEIYPTTIREYINVDKLRYKSNKINYIVKDKYLYILNPEIENVNIYIYAVDNSFQLEPCQSMYEADLKIPSYLHKSLFDMVTAEILKYIQLPQDVTDNNLNEKT